MKNSKTLEVVGSIASIISVLISIYQWLNPDDTETVWTISLPGSTLCLGLLVAALTIFFYLRRRDAEFVDRENDVANRESAIAVKEEQVIPKLYNYSHVLSHGLRDNLFQIHSIRDKAISELAKPISEREDEQTDDEILNSYEVAVAQIDTNFMEMVLNSLRDHIVGHWASKLIVETCGASIKFATPTVPNDEVSKWRLKTALRDNLATAERSKHDKKPIDSFIVEENTGCYETGYMDENSFACNALSDLIIYRNQNPDWESHYNATLIVPIRYTPIDFENELGGSTPLLYGFLAVDSMNTHGQTLFKAGTDCPIFHMVANVADQLAVSIKVTNDAADMLFTETPSTDRVK